MFRKNIIKTIIAISLASVALSANSNIPTASLAKTKVHTRASAASAITAVGTQTVADSGECSANQFYISGSVTGTDDDGNGLDEITCEVYDDGELKDSATVTVPVGSTQDVNISLYFEGLYGVGAPGVGLYCQDIGYSEDPFVPTDIAGTCTSAAVSVPLSNNAKIILSLLFAFGAFVMFRKRKILQ